MARKLTDLSEEEQKEILEFQNKYNSETVKPSPVVEEPKEEAKEEEIVKEINKKIAEDRSKVKLNLKEEDYEKKIDELGKQEGYNFKEDYDMVKNTIYQQVFSPRANKVYSYEEAQALTPEKYYDDLLNAGHGAPETYKEMLNNIANAELSVPPNPITTIPGLITKASATVLPERALRQYAWGLAEGTGIGALAYKYVQGLKGAGETAIKAIQGDEKAQEEIKNTKLNASSILLGPTLGNSLVQSKGQEKVDELTGKLNTVYSGDGATASRITGNVLGGVGTLVAGSAVGAELGPALGATAKVGSNVGAIGTGALTSGARTATYTDNPVDIALDTVKGGAQTAVFLGTANALKSAIPLNLGTGSAVSTIAKDVGRNVLAGSLSAYTSTSTGKAIDVMKRYIKGEPVTDKDWADVFVSGEHLTSMALGGVGYGIQGTIADIQTAKTVNEVIERLNETNNVAVRIMAYQMKNGDVEGALQTFYTQKALINTVSAVDYDNGLKVPTSYFNDMRNAFNTIGETFFGKLASNPTATPNTPAIINNGTPINYSAIPTGGIPTQSASYNGASAIPNAVNSLADVDIIQEKGYNGPIIDRRNGIYFDSEKDVHIERNGIPKNEVIYGEKLYEAIDDDTPKLRTDKPYSKHFGDYYFVFKKNAHNNYTVISQIAIKGNEELINSLEKGMKKYVDEGARSIAKDVEALELSRRNDNINNVNDTRFEKSNGTDNISETKVAERRTSGSGRSIGKSNRYSNTKLKNSNQSSFSLSEKEDVNLKVQENERVTDESTLKTLNDIKNTTKFMADVLNGSSKNPGLNNIDNSRFEVTAQDPETIVVQHKNANGEVLETMKISNMTQALKDGDYIVDTSKIKSVKKIYDEIQSKLRDMYTKSQDALVNDSMTESDVKKMLRETYTVNGLEQMFGNDFYDVNDWLRRFGPDEIAEWIENTPEVYNKYIATNQDILDEKYSMSDVLQNYLDKKLKNVKREPTRLDTSNKNPNYTDNRFYAPAKISSKEAKSLYEFAKQKATGVNKKKIYDARAKVIIGAQDPDFVKELGVDSKTLNKDLRNWANYSKRAQDTSNELNKGVSDQNRWSGIENSSILNTFSVTDDDLNEVVKDILGDSAPYERRYILSTLLAIDTHTDFSNLTLDFVKHGTLKKDVLGDYSQSNDLIRISDAGQNTVAHEIGHFLDFLWGRQIFGKNIEISARATAEEINKLPTKQRQFVDNLYIFLNDIEKSADMTSRYTIRPTEVFARFVARFVEWTKNTATSNRYGIEARWYQDGFNSRQFKEFVKLLQEKSLLDTTEKLHSGKAPNSVTTTPSIEPLADMDNPSKNLTVEKQNKDLAKLEKANEKLRDKLAKEKEKNKQTVLNKNKEKKEAVKAQREKDKEKIGALKTKHKEAVKDAKLRARATTTDKKMRLANNRLNKSLQNVYDKPKSEELEKALTAVQKSTRGAIKLIGNVKNKMPSSYSHFIDDVEEIVNTIYTGANAMTEEKRANLQKKADAIKKFIEEHPEYPISQKALDLLKEPSKKNIADLNPVDLVNMAEEVAEIGLAVRDMFAFSRSSEDAVKLRNEAIEFLKQRRKEGGTRSNDELPKNKLKYKTKEFFRKELDKRSTLKTLVLRLAGGNPNSPFRFMSDTLDEAYSKYNKDTEEMFKPFDKFVKIKKVGNVRTIHNDLNDITDHSKEIKTTLKTKSGKDYHPSIADAVSLWWGMKDPQFAGHVTGVLTDKFDSKGKPLMSKGGIARFSNRIDQMYGSQDTGLKRGESIKITMEDVKKIVAEVEKMPFAKEFEEAYRELATITGKLANETNEAILGTSIETRDNYFRVVTDPATRLKQVQKDPTVGNQELDASTALLNSSIVKPVIIGADNQILIYPIDEVILKLISDTALYNAYGTALYDINTFLSGRDEDGRTIVELINDIDPYFLRNYNNITNALVGRVKHPNASAMASRYTSAILKGNIWIALKQAGSYFTTAKYFDHPFRSLLAGAFNKKNIASKIKDMYKERGVDISKLNVDQTLRYFWDENVDAEIATRARGWNTATKEQLLKHLGILQHINALDFFKGVDYSTVRALAYAMVYDTILSGKFNDSKEYFAELHNRFLPMNIETQPNTNAVTRTPIQSSSNPVDRALAYMGDPRLKTLNMLMDSRLEHKYYKKHGTDEEKKRDKKNYSRAILGVIGSLAFLTSIARTKNKIEGKDDEKGIKGFLKDMLGNAIALTAGLEQITGKFMDDYSFDVELPDTQAFNIALKVYDDFSNFITNLQSGKTNKVIKYGNNVIGDISKFVGIPYQNLKTIYDDLLSLTGSEAYYENKINANDNAYKKYKKYEDKITNLKEFYTIYNATREKAVKDRYGKYNDDNVKKAIRDNGGSVSQWFSIMKRGS